MPNGLALFGDLYCERFQRSRARREDRARIAQAQPPLRQRAHDARKDARRAAAHDEAREAFHAAIEDGAYAKNQFIVDDQVSIWKAQSEMGSSYANEGNDTKALEWFEKGLANAPSVEPLMINRAKAFERLGRIDEAYDAYKKAFDEHQSAQGMLYFVNYLLRMQRWPEALEIVDGWYTKLPPFQASELLLGAAGVSERYGADREEYYLRLAAELQPASAAVLEHLERVLRAKGKVDQLATILEREFDGTPVTHKDWIRRAHRALDAKRPELSVEAADAALAAQPDDVDMLLTRAAAFELLASPVGVEESLLRAQRVDPVRAAVALSMFYLRSERFAEAAAVADAALKP